MNPGVVIANRYTVIRTIGSGGMGDVYQARRLQDGVMVAVKVLREDLLKDGDSVARFRREARAAAALRSEFAARILDVGELPSGQPFIVMEYLEGRDLMAEIDARGRIPLAEAAHYVSQACQAMIEAHQLGIVHRDLKPPNIFLASERDGRKVKVLDFGISKITTLQDGHLTSTQSSFGSPLYMSPEQIRSTKLVDARSDVWSLGVMLYEAVVGEPPFVAETAGGLAVAISVEPFVPPSQKHADLPKAFDDLMAGVLQKDVTKRYQSAAELLRALEEFLPRGGFTGGQTLVVSPTSAPEQGVGFVTTAPAPVSRPVSGSSGQVPVGAAALTAPVKPPHITLGPATTDPPRPSSKPERFGLIAAALLLPLGAAAFGFAIWLYSRKGPDPVRTTTATTLTTEAAASAEAQEPEVTPQASAVPTPALSSDPPAARGSASGAASSSGSSSKPKGKPKGKPKPKPTTFIPGAP